jgi:hypothetical protein
MNCYTTKSFRARPQVIQRHYETRLTDGSKFSAHGVKGQNGEWDLETYSGGDWNRLGIAWKTSGGWEMRMDEDTTIKARTIAELIKRAWEYETGVGA